MAKGRIWNEMEALIVWKSSRTEKEYLSKLFKRSEDALECAFIVKDQTLQLKDINRFYNPKTSNPEKYFIKFKEQGIEFIK